MASLTIPVGILKGSMGLDITAVLACSDYDRIFLGLQSGRILSFLVSFDIVQQDSRGVDDGSSRERKKYNVVLESILMNHQSPVIALGYYLRENKNSSELKEKLIDQKPLKMDPSDCSSKIVDYNFRAKFDPKTNFQVDSKNYIVLVSLTEDGEMALWDTNEDGRCIMKNSNIFGKSTEARGMIICDGGSYAIVWGGPVHSPLIHVVRLCSLEIVTSIDFPCPIELKEAKVECPNRIEMLEQVVDDRFKNSLAKESLSGAKKIHLGNVVSIEDVDESAQVTQYHDEILSMSTTLGGLDVLDCTSLDSLTKFDEIGSLQKTDTSKELSIGADDLSWITSGFWCGEENTIYLFSWRLNCYSIRIESFTGLIRSKPRMLKVPFPLYCEEKSMCDANDTNSTEYNELERLKNISLEFMARHSRMPILYCAGATELTKSFSKFYFASRTNVWCMSHTGSIELLLSGAIDIVGLLPDAVVCFCDGSILDYYSGRRFNLKANVRTKIIPITWSDGLLPCTMALYIDGYLNASVDLQNVFSTIIIPKDVKQILKWNQLSKNAINKDIGASSENERCIKDEFVFHETNQSAAIGFGRPESPSITCTLTWERGSDMRIIHGLEDGSIIVKPLLEIASTDQNSTYECPVGPTCSNHTLGNNAEPTKSDGSICVLEHIHHAPITCLVIIRGGRLISGDQKGLVIFWSISDLSVTSIHKYHYQNSPIIAVVSLMGSHHQSHSSAIGHGVNRSQTNATNLVGLSSTESDSHAKQITERVRASTEDEKNSHSGSPIFLTIDLWGSISIIQGERHIGIIPRRGDPVVSVRWNTERKLALIYRDGSSSVWSLATLKQSESAAEDAVRFPNGCEIIPNGFNRTSSVFCNSLLANSLVWKVEQSLLRDPVQVFTVDIRRLVETFESRLFEMSTFSTQIDTALRLILPLLMPWGISYEVDELCGKCNLVRPNSNICIGISGFNGTTSFPCLTRPILRRKTCVTDNPGSSSDLIEDIEAADNENSFISQRSSTMVALLQISSMALLSMASGQYWDELKASLSRITSASVDHASCYWDDPNEVIRRAGRIVTTIAIESMDSNSLESLVNSWSNHLPFQAHNSPAGKRRTNRATIVLGLVALKCGTRWIPNLKNLIESMILLMTEEKRSLFRGVAVEIMSNLLGKEVLPLNIDAYAVFKALLLYMVTLVSIVPSCEVGKMHQPLDDTCIDDKSRYFVDSVALRTSLNDFTPATESVNFLKNSTSTPEKLIVTGDSIMPQGIKLEDSISSVNLSDIEKSPSFSASRVQEQDFSLVFSITNTMCAGNIVSIKNAIKILLSNRSEEIVFRWLEEDFVHMRSLNYRWTCLSLLGFALKNDCSRDGLGRYLKIYIETAYRLIRDTRSSRDSRRLMLIAIPFVERLSLLCSNVCFHPTTFRVLIGGVLGDSAMRVYDLRLSSILKSTGSTSKSADGHHQPGSVDCKFFDGHNTYASTACSMHLNASGSKLIAVSYSMDEATLRWWQIPVTQHNSAGGIMSAVFSSSGNTIKALRMDVVDPALTEIMLSDTKYLNLVTFDWKMNEGLLRINVDGQVKFTCRIP